MTPAPIPNHLAMERDMADPTVPEEWRLVADFPDYAVSNFGRVRRETDGKVRSTIKAGHLLRAHESNGYPYVSLYRGDARRCDVVVGRHAQEGADQ